MYKVSCPDLGERYFAWLCRGKLTRLNAAEAQDYVEDILEARVHWRRIALWAADLREEFEFDM
jgi:hypothetical protein